MSTTVAYTMDRELRFTWVHSPIAGNSMEVSAGKSLHDVFVKETADRIAGFYCEVMRTGLRARFDLTVQSLFKPATQHFDYVAEPLRDACGAITGVIVAARDITARKQADETLRKNVALTRLAADTARMTYAEFDFKTGRLQLADNFARVMGYTLPSLTEQTDIAKTSADMLSHIAPEYREQVQAANREFVTGKGDGAVTYRVICDDGAQRWIEGRWIAEVDEKGCPVRAIAASLDITERKRSEEALALAKAEAERANIAKSKFLAAASHDLRQPVQSLTLLLGAIERQIGDEPKTAKMVQIAKASMASLNGMLAGILDISRLDAGVITPTRTSVNLGELVDRMAREYAPRMAKVGLVLRHVSRVLRAQTDLVLLERILRNLTENALRFTARGGVLIGVRRRGECARLDVIDTGIGIPADQQSEIFEEFRQLNNPARDSSQGLGLGLSIVSRLAQLIGAEVQVASRPGRGTRFSLLLPLEPNAPAPVEGKVAVDSPGGRILVIEDDEAVRQSYETLLECLGYEVLSADTGEKALAVAEQEGWRFDVVLADHRLGAGLNGTATAAEISRRAGRAVPTVVVTGDTARERLEEISASGFAMLHKPVEVDELIKTLASLLSGDARATSGVCP